MMEDFKWKILKTCCDRLELTLNTSVTYSMNDHFCSIVIDCYFIAATNGTDLTDTINATISKALQLIEKNQLTDFNKRCEYVAEIANIDFETELRRIFPAFENYMNNLKKRVINVVTPEKTVAEFFYDRRFLTPPIDIQNYYSQKSYNTSAEIAVPVIKLEPREVKVVERKMLLSNHNCIDKNNIGFKMLMGLGWNGGPLGINQHGIAEPISVEVRSNRRGLGCVDQKSIKSADILTYSNLFEYLKEYAHNDHQFDVLEFSDDFSNKEKNMLFGISKDLNLQHVSDHRNGNLVIKIMKPKHY